MVLIGFDTKQQKKKDMIIGKVECGERVVGGLQRGPGGKTFQTQSVNGGREKVSALWHTMEQAKERTQPYRFRFSSVSRFFFRVGKVRGAGRRICGQEGSVECLLTLAEK